jgi:uncharacterized protein (DUF924 family)
MREKYVAPDEILSFWFGAGPDNGAEAARLFKIWFSVDPLYDAAIRDRFGAIIERAAAGEFDNWARTARGALALIVMLDQFPRNIYRGQARAFATDDHALSITTRGIAEGLDVGLTLVERVFFYVPFEHAEDLAAQDRCVSLYQALDALAPADYKEITHICVAQSQQHRDVIRRFARFPNRNEILGRTSSAAERAWTDSHDGWGQKTDKR